MKKITIYYLLIILSLSISCSKKQEKSKTLQTEVDIKNLESDFMTWWTYHSKNIVLSSDFTPKNQNAKIISKDDFLKELTTGDFIPLKLKSTDGLYYYQLFKLDETADKSIGSTMKNISIKGYNHFKMEGAKFPKFSFIDLKGIHYTNEKTKGKILILKCWFINCKPCIAEFPELNALEKKYQNREDILFISLAFDSKKALQDFLIKKPFSYAVVPNQREFMEDVLKVHTYPTHFVIDKNGIIKKVVNKVDEMLSAFNKEFNK